MDKNAVYIDEHGNRVDPSQLGNYQADQQQQNPAVTNPTNLNLNAMMQQHERVSNFISQTSPTNSIERINYILQGHVFNESKKEWVKVSDGIPERIRLDFLQFLTPILSEDIRMTNLDSRQINGIMEMSIEWVTDYLDVIADEFDLENKNITDPKKRINLDETQMTKIGLILLHAEFITLLRSHAGMEMSKMYKSLSLGDSYNNPNVNPNVNNQGKWWQFWR